MRGLSLSEEWMGIYDGEWWGAWGEWWERKLGLVYKIVFNLNEIN